MARFLSSRHLREGLFALALALCAIALLVYPTQAVEAAREGLRLCGNVIIPSLFPFFVLSNFSVEIGLIRHLGRLLEPLMRPLFKVSGICASAFVLGIIGGYPVGAKTAIALYEKRCISKEEAQRLLAFCNNCGPAFIFGVVGAGVFASSKVGLLLYLVHILASILVGIIFRMSGGNSISAAHSAVRIEAISFSAAFTGSIKAALQSTLNICAFVLFFTVFVRLMVLSGILSVFSSLLGTLLIPLGCTEQLAEKLLIGAIEMSSGVASLSGAAGTLPARLALSAFVLGWAGLCVHCQVLSFLGSSGLSARSYLLGKLLHGSISAAMIALLIRILPLDLQVASVYAQQIDTMAGLDFSGALTASTVTAAIVWCAFAVISLWVMRKGTGNRRRKRV